MSIQSNKAEIDELRGTVTTLNQTLTNLMNGTKKFADFTDAEALYALTNIHKGDIQVHIDSSLDKTDLYCFGQKAGINNGAPFTGWRSTVANPSDDSDFDIKGFSA